MEAHWVLEDGSERESEMQRGQLPAEPTLGMIAMPLHK